MHMFRSRMAPFASGVIGGQIPLHLRMRRVAAQTTQLALALPETCAGRQRRRLMTHVPRISKIERLVRTQGHPVALAAKIIQLVGRKLSRILRAEFCGSADMRRRRSMTGFA